MADASLVHHRYDDRFLRYKNVERVARDVGVMWVLREPDIFRDSEENCFWTRRDSTGPRGPFPRICRRAFARRSAGCRALTLAFQLQLLISGRAVQADIHSHAPRVPRCLAVFVPFAHSEEHRQRGRVCGSCNWSSFVRLRVHVPPAGRAAAASHAAAGTPVPRHEAGGTRAPAAPPRCCREGAHMTITTTAPMAITPQSACPARRRPVCVSCSAPTETRPRPAVMS